LDINRMLNCTRNLYLEEDMMEKVQQILGIQVSPISKVLTNRVNRTLKIMRALVEPMLHICIGTVRRCE